MYDLSADCGLIARGKSEPPGPGRRESAVFVVETESPCCRPGIGGRLDGGSGPPWRPTTAAAAAAADLNRRRPE